MLMADFALILLTVVFLIFGSTILLTGKSVINWFVLLPSKVIVGTVKIVDDILRDRAVLREAKANADIAEEKLRNEILKEFFINHKEKENKHD